MCVTTLAWSTVISIAVIKYPDKLLEGERVSFCSQFYVTAPHSGEFLDGRNLHIHNQEQREMNKCILLACLLSTSFSSLIWFRTPCLRNGAIHGGLNLPTSINK